MESIKYFHAFVKKENEGKRGGMPGIGFDNRALYSALSGRPIGDQGGIENNQPVKCKHEKFVFAHRCLLSAGPL